MRPTIPLLDWRIALDLEQTKYLHKKIDLPTDGCTCLFCTNWKMVWKKVFSPEITEQLKRLQIDPERPSEMYQQGSSESNQFRITFNCVGRILSGPAVEVYNEKINDTVRNYITIEKSPYSTMLSVAYENNVIHQALGKVESIKGQIIQVDFITKVPWVLSENPESVSVPLNPNAICNRRLTSNSS